MLSNTMCMSLQCACASGFYGLGIVLVIKVVRAELNPFNKMNFAQLLIG